MGNAPIGSLSLRFSRSAVPGMIHTAPLKQLGAVGKQSIAPSVIPAPDDSMSVTPFPDAVIAFLAFQDDCRLFFAGPLFLWPIAGSSPAPLLIYHIFRWRSQFQKYWLRFVGNLFSRASTPY